MHLSYRIPATLTCVLLLQSTGALAQNNDDEEFALAYGDKSTVSIATGSQQSLRRAPAVATVITAEDIAAMGATDLDQVLETVPGMHVARSAIAYEPQFLMRGIYSSTNPQILLLQNGIPMTTMFLGNKGNVWGGYPVENIARVEVIRGPGSALYGADAYSGVINIITKSASDTHGTRAGAALGSFNTRDAWVQHGGKWGNADVAAYLRVGGTDGIKEIVTSDAQTIRDARAGTHASLAPGPVHTGYDAIDGNIDFGYDKLHFRADYKLRYNVQEGAGVAFALDPAGRSRSERITSDVSWNDPQFAKDWGVNAAASYLQYKQRIESNLQLFPPGTLFPTGLFPYGMIGHPDTSERQIRLSAFANYSGFAGHNLRFGLGHDDLDLYDTVTIKNYLFNAQGIPTPVGPVADYSLVQPFMLPQRRRIDYVYAQDEWNFAKDWTATAGVRHDRYSDFGSTTNPRLALVWDAALDVTTKLLYGRAFRAPSFNEEYGINNPVFRGNPALRPETISTLELAVAWQARKDIQLNFNIFKYQMKDVIFATPNPAPALGTTLNNAGSQNGTGAELELIWDVARNMRFTGNYSHQRSVDELTHQDAGYAPHNHVYGRFDWQVAESLLFSPQVNYVANRMRSAGDTRPRVPDYTTLDLSVRTSRGTEHWDFAASVRNLFNADVREPTAPGTIANDLPMARRAFYVQAMYRM